MVMLQRYPLIVTRMQQILQAIVIKFGYRSFLSPRESGGCLSTRVIQNPPAEVGPCPAPPRREWRPAVGRRRRRRPPPPGSCGVATAEPSAAVQAYRTVDDRRSSTRGCSTNAMTSYHALQPRPYH